MSEKITAIRAARLDGPDPSAVIPGLLAEALEARQQRGKPR
jgi:hypothetical protein